MSEVPISSQILARFSSPGETWSELLARVSSIVASGPDRQEFHEALRSGHFVPAGQIWRQAGRPGGILYNCFVAPVEPTEPAAEIAARVSTWTAHGCGVGINVTRWIRNPHRSAHNALHTILTQVARSQDRLWQAGSRRTATMVNVDLHAPGLPHACQSLNHNPLYRHLNIGVTITDAQMRTIATCLDKNHTSHDLTRLRDLASCIWSGGNPGIIFIDTVNRPHPFHESVDACNPCAEQYLLPAEGCNLGSLNLASFVLGRRFDWQLFRSLIAISVRFLNQVIEVSNFPSPTSARMARARRRIGLGIMGFASALELLGLPYDSEDSLQFAEAVASMLKQAATETSEQLARLYQPFPDYHHSSITIPRRNALLTSVAPTGAISLLWRVSSGIEPIFASAIKKGEHTLCLDLTPPANRRTALDISPSYHIRMTSVWQKYIDSGISKTVNIPREFTVDDILSLIVSAWRQGCKGVSVFRDQSRPAAYEVVIP